MECFLCISVTSMHTNEQSLAHFTVSFQCYSAVFACFLQSKHSCGKVVLHMAYGISAWIVSRYSIFTVVKAIPSMWNFMFSWLWRCTGRQDTWYMDGWNNKKNDSHFPLTCTIFSCTTYSSTKHGSSRFL